MGKKRTQGAAEKATDGASEVIFDPKDNPAEFAAFRKELHKINPQPLRESSSDGEDTISIAKVQKHAASKKRASGKSSRKRKDDTQEESSKGGWAGTILFAMMFMPALIEMVDLGGGVVRGLSRFAASLTEPRALATAVSFVAAPLLLYVVLPRRWFARIIILVTLASLLMPTVNVYTCSPAKLNNSHFGTNFSLKAKTSEILTSTIGDCVKGRPFSSYSMSAYKPRFVLWVQRAGVQELNLTNSDGQFRILLLQSPRSVRGQVHYLNTMAKIPKRLAKKGVVDDLMARNRTDADTYRFIGRLQDMPTNMQYIRSHLQQQNMYVRPVLLETHDLELVG